MTACPMTAAPEFKPRPGIPTPVNPPTLAGDLTRAVLAADDIPAHDFTLDTAEHVGELLAALWDYVTDVRDAKTADAAVREFAAAITDAVDGWI